MKAWVGTGNDGGLVDDTTAMVSIYDHGLTVGDGVFETLKVTDRGPFALRRHLDRLALSAAAIGLTPPEPEFIRNAALEVWRARASVAGGLARMRITVTGGVGPLGSERGSAKPHLIISMAPQRPWPAAASLQTVPWTRNERGALTGVKSTSYAENVVALNYAREHGADEGVFVNTRGFVAEGTSTNIFIVLDEVVLTPPLTSGCLAGVTRALVLEWGTVREQDFHLDEGHRADEVFMTSSTRDIQPVLGWDGVRWSAPGPVTQSLMAQFAERSMADIDP